MKIRLSDHFTYSRLLRFTLPSVVMMIFTSIYGVVDGFFRIKLRRLYPVCRREFYHAVPYGIRRGGLYGRRGRQRAGIYEAGSAAEG